MVRVHIISFVDNIWHAGATDHFAPGIRFTPELRRSLTYSEDPKGPSGQCLHLPAGSHLHHPLPLLLPPLLLDRLRQSDILHPSVLVIAGVSNLATMGLYGLPVHPRM